MIKPFDFYFYFAVSYTFLAHKKIIKIKIWKNNITQLKKISKVFNVSFIKAVDLILNCKGKVIFAGIGKSGLIARKISATFSSVGIPSFFIDQTPGQNY